MACTDKNATCAKVRVARLHTPGLHCLAMLSISNATTITLRAYLGQSMWVLHCLQAVFFLLRTRPESSRYLQGRLKPYCSLISRIGSPHVEWAPRSSSTNAVIVSLMILAVSTLCVPELQCPYFSLSTGKLYVFVSVLSATSFHVTGR